MRNECNIVKDLLPLCIDGAVSEDSRKLVEEHTALCESCAETRRQMMLLLPEDRDRHVEQAVLKKAAQKLRRKHMRRGGLLTIAGLLLGVMLIFCVRGLHWYLWEDINVPMPLDRYEVHMSTLESGRLILSFVHPSFSYGYSGRYENAEDGDGLVFTLQLHTTRLPRKEASGRQVSTIDDWVWQDGKVLLESGGQQVVSIVREGPHGDRDVLYQYGVDESLIAPASAELEAYCRLDDEIALCWDLYYTDSSVWALIDETELPFTRIGDDDDAFRTKMDKLYREQVEVRSSVPEWQ